MSKIRREKPENMAGLLGRGTTVKTCIVLIGAPMKSKDSAAAQDIDHMCRRSSWREIRRLLVKVRRLLLC